MLTTGTLPASITLRTIAAFVPVGVCISVILIAAILLAVPLISRVNLPFGSYNAEFRVSLGEIQAAETPSITSRPSSPPLPPAAPQASVLRSPCPRPVRKSSEEPMAESEENRSPELFEFEFGDNFLAKSCPVFGETALVNYNSYRHKLIEETLQKQYGGGYAPGNVILNLIQLNTADSAASVVSSNKYDSNFLDHFEFGEAFVSSCKSRETDQFPDPLAHFIPRNFRKASTTETQTETAPVSGISISVKGSGVPSARPNTTPTISRQRIISKRSREADCAAKSPHVTPIHSQSPLNARRSSLTERTRDPKTSDSGKGESNLPPNVVLIRDRDRAPLTEQLYRRNDTRPDAVSRTHLEAEEYLNRIAKTKRYEAAGGRREVREPKIGSSLKRSRAQVDGAGMGFFGDNEKVPQSNERTGDCGGKIRRPPRDYVGRLSTSKPAIWNNRCDRNDHTCMPTA